MAANREILMKFITQQNEKVKQDISMQGYKDNSPYRNNPSNTIYGTPEGTSITMQGVSTPLVGIDEFGNRQEMFPGQQYQYPGSRVTETPMAKYGGLLNKTITCSNCGWKWKAADGGNDVTTCHKCGNENTIMQEGGEKDFNKVKEWFNNYIDSPLYKRNLENSGYLDVDKVINQRKSNVGKTEYVYDENRLGTYYQPNTNTVHHAPIKDSEIWSKEFESVLPQDSVLAHEFGHSVLDDSKSFFGKQTPGYNRYDYEQLQKRNKDRKISRGPNENYADQKALQYEAAKLGIYKPGYEEFTKEHLDKLPVHIKDRALKNYSEEDLIWLMNNIAQNNNNTNDMLAVAQEGGDPSSTLEGLTDEERQRKIDENTAYQLENIKKVREEEKIKEEESKRKAQEEHNAFIKKNFNPDAVEKRKNLFDKVVSENEYPSTSFHEEWMNSPQYKKLLTESTVENNSFDLYNDIRNRNLQELKGKKINTSEDSFKPGAIAYFSPEERTINYPFDRNELDTLGGNFSNDFNRSVAVHEKSHFIDNLFAEGQKKFRLNSRLLRKELKNREDDEVSAIPLKDVDLINSLKVPKTDDNKFKYDYFTEPTEVRARLNEVRDNLFNSGNKEFLNRELNEEDLKSLYNDIDLNTNQGFRDLNDYFGKEGTLKLLNSVSQNNNNINNQMPVAKRGGTWFGNADEMSVSNKYDIGGTTVAEQYTQLTGKPWSTARAQGLTDGTAKQNLALIARLKQQQKPVETPTIVEVANSSDKSAHTKEMAQRVVQLAEERIKTNNYVDVPDDIKTIAFQRGEGAFGCIGGVCTVLKDAGVMNTVDWSNTHFAENAKDYGFTANQGWGVKGIQNLEPGDVLMTSQDRNASGKYYPTHSQIYLGKTKSGQLRFFDNFWKSERTYYEDEIKERLDPKRKKTEQHATIYKVNPYDDTNPLGLTPEEKKNYDDKQEFIKKESTSKASYKWGISPTAKDYNDNSQRVMDKFIEFANDNDKINELVKKTGKSKEEIHDSLLNVFGELGTENNWTTSKGKGLGSRLENIAESIFTSLGGGKKLSVGPGQIKYSSIPKDLKQKFDIKSPNDLYNLDKVLPLMAAMDLKDKQVLENWGENNTLSQKLFGWTRPEIDNGGGPGITTGGFKASQLASETGNSILDNGIGRYSPYLRNQYLSIDSGTTYEGGNDWIPFNEGTMPNFSPAIYNESGEDEMRVKYQRDPGSYPYKVEQNWRDNIKREIVLNEDGEIELNEIVIKGKNKNR